MRITKLDDGSVRELSILIGNNNLIPVIGSGFTCGCHAKCGQVPSGAEMKKFVMDELSKYEDANEDYTQYDLKTLVTIFDSSKGIPPFEKRDYLSKNFTEVTISRARDYFLNIPWPCIYTINIDDAIERSTKRKVILPMRNFTDQYIEDFSIVFKLHGDVHNCLAYGEHGNIILSYTQYIDSLSNNRKMLTKFKSDLADNNLIFIGCSLIGEHDLFFTAKSEIEGNRFNRKIYYIAYGEITNAQKVMLECFGVTDCIIIADLDSFCREIRLQLKSETFSNNPLDYFSRNIHCLSREDSNSLFMLTSDALAPLASDSLFKPKFLIERDELTNVISSLKKSPIYIIFGHRISGKTYFLFSIYEKMIAQDRYFFPSGTKISSAMFNEILDKENTLTIFDSGTLSTKQIIDITNNSNINKLKQNHSYILFAVNSSDSIGIDIEEIDTIYKTTYLNNVFSKHESDQLLAELQLCNIPIFTFRKKSDIDGDQRFITKTLLDNLYELSQYEHSRLPLPDLSKILDPEEIAFWILIAVKQVIDMEEIYYYDFRDMISNYLNAYPILINKDFSAAGGRINSRNKFTLNARYYILAWLGTLAEKQEMHELILSAYLYLFESIKYNEEDKIQQINRKMLDLIKFDVINDIFYKRTEAVTLLIKYIYEKFEDKLNTTPQFKHQRAKSILWLCSDKIDDIKSAANYIDLAIHDIEELSTESPDKSGLQKSLNHARLTQAIIYGRLTALDRYKDYVLLEKALNNYAYVLLDPINEAIIDSLKNKSDNHVIYSDLRALKRHINRERSLLPENILTPANALFQAVKF